MKKFISFIVVCLSLSACTQSYQVSKDQAKSAMESITYARDSKTNLCFAILGSLGDSSFVKQSITYVPCTPEVVSLVK